MIWVTFSRLTQTKSVVADADFTTGDIPHWAPGRSVQNYTDSTVELVAR